MTHFREALYPPAHQASRALLQRPSRLPQWLYAVSPEPAPLVGRRCGPRRGIYEPGALAKARVDPACGNIIHYRDHARIVDFRGVDIGKHWIWHGPRRLR